MTVLNRREFCKGVTLAAGLSPAAVAATSQANVIQKENSAVFRRAKQAVYVADLDQCLPQSALSRTGARYCWRMLDFETDRFQGVMLFAGEETEAAEVSYPLRARGWHDVYVGIFTGALAFNLLEDQSVWVKLEDDPAFSFISTTRPVDAAKNREAGPRIQDVFWKTADLTGQTISLRQPRRKVVPDDQPHGNRCSRLYVAYIKLVPLTESEAEGLQRDRRRDDTKRLFAYNDAWSFHFDRGKTTPDGDESTEETVRGQLEPYRHSDFSRIYWDGVHGDVCNYFTKVGRMWTREQVQLGDFVRAGDRQLTESWSKFVENRIDPFRVAAEFSREIGLEFHACYRLGWRPFYWPPPFDEYNDGGFYDKHPELRCQSRDGQPAPGISFVFPETQDYVLSLVDEMAAYPIDGIAILYNRQPPFLEYEGPAVDGFRNQYGEDPRNLNASDPRWLSYRSQYLTIFMRRLRETLQTTARRRGQPRPLPVTAWVFGSAQENLFHGIDIKTWVEENLVDTLVPYTSAKNLFSFEPAWEDPRDVAYWVQLTRGTNCQLALNVMPRNLESEQYLRKAKMLYGAGVEHLAFWDTAIAGGRAVQTLRRLGHKQEIADWLAEGLPVPPTSFLPVRKLGDWKLDYIPE